MKEINLNKIFFSIFTVYLLFVLLCYTIFVFKNNYVGGIIVFATAFIIYKINFKNTVNEIENLKIQRSKFDNYLEKIKKSDHKIFEEIKSLQGHNKFLQNKLEAIEVKYGIASYCNDNTNVIAGIRCKNCKEDYSISLDDPKRTKAICPYCFYV